jgi:hypothetical protein
MVNLKKKKLLAIANYKSCVKSCTIIIFHNLLSPQDTILDHITYMAKKKKSKSKSCRVGKNSQELCLRVALYRISKKFNKI